jgi:ABC-type transport system involved in multi-copper enzyme maturation permease subunit
MMMNPALRKVTYTTHITSSIGWIGAVIVFIALAALALTTPDEATVRGAYLVMAPAAWFALVPLAHASLLSGIVLSLGTTWGLMRHYWVVIKLGITVFCTVMLMIYMGTFRQMAGVAADPVVNVDAVRNASPLLHASIALVLLLITTVLGVYKPFGMTPYGWRKQIEQRSALSSAGVSQRSVSRHRPARAPLWVYAAGIVALGLLLLIVVMHLLGRGMAHH